MYPWQNPAEMSMQEWGMGLNKQGQTRNRIINLFG
jgi:hypothetical protein